MPRWLCICGCLYAAGAPCCPQCRATAHEEEDGVEKIASPGNPPGHPPADRVTGLSAAALAAGEGQEPHAVEHPADGTLSPPVSNEPAPGQPPGAEVTQEPPGPTAGPVTTPGPDSTPPPSSPASSAPAEPAPVPAPKPAPAPARAPKKAPAAGS